MPERSDLPPSSRENRILSWIFRRKAARAKRRVREGVDILEAAAVNAHHDKFKPTERRHVHRVFGAAAGLLGVGSALVWATHGLPALAGYGLMSAGKLALIRGGRVLKPYNPHQPAAWAPGSRTAAVVDFLESASRNLAHPWMKPASPTHARLKMFAGASAAVIGLALGLTTVGMPSVAGTVLYAVGGFVGYRAYRTLNPFQPGAADRGPIASLRMG